MKATPYIVTNELQNVIEDYFTNEPIGACYLFGYCLNKIFNELGYSSREVSGKLGILLNKGNGKYISYGKLKNYQQIGDYHTWCEIIYQGEKLIVDPSLKYNLDFLKKNGFKANKKVSTCSLRKAPLNNYYLKYVEDKTLKSISHRTLNMAINLKTRTHIIQTTINRIKDIHKQKAA